MVDMSISERDIALFFLGWRGFVDTADAVLAEHGLGRVDHRVLYVVVRQPGITVSELAGALGISRQALHRPLSGLLRRGYVTRSASARSGRERALSATAAGAAVERAATGPQLAQLEHVVAAAGDAALAGWRAVMRGLAEATMAAAPPRTRHLIES
ncbi:MarR family transcriptional regulator [Phytohabitans aurantiacus]|jgi:DNA-binding MarR family transcriptional regulator|uniref:MarR family transcriptional regulator n=1 Tax=Phytohabitans aurantiacus TaxID=3016789 RepID=A0ABQ5QP40_9ACTN|nr:helix-turn-helix domain-containing protein [Phytohabitans aurantiacus]GLH96416.1 MarR family transcriptional regulator [Phytohabitans aurantiacus]